MSLRLDDINQKENNTRLSLQTVDYRLAKLEELMVQSLGDTSKMAAALADIQVRDASKMAAALADIQVSDTSKMAAALADIQVRDASEMATALA